MKQQQQEQFIRQFQQWAQQVLQQPGLAVWVVREQLEQLQRQAERLNAGGPR